MKDYSVTLSIKEWVLICALLKTTKMTQSGTYWSNLDKEGQRLLCKEVSTHKLEKIRDNIRSSVPGLKTIVSYDMIKMFDKKAEAPKEIGCREIAYGPDGISVHGTDDYYVLQLEELEAMVKKCKER